MPSSQASDGGSNFQRNMSLPGGDHGPIFPTIVSAPQRARRTRWGSVTDNVAGNLVGLPTAITACMTSEQLEAYALHLRIKEIGEKLRVGFVAPNDGHRSPSPPPQYDRSGRRVNTREMRYQQRLKDESHLNVQRALKLFPNYVPPPGYTHSTKLQDKVFLPVNDFPSVNFIGLLIGPRGETLKELESKSGAKIAIRGRGSVKEGKARADTAYAGQHEDEDLHCLIVADTKEKVNIAKKMIHNVIETVDPATMSEDNEYRSILQEPATTTGERNAMKIQQLRRLAELNGTFRDYENQACQNCGRTGHRKYDCTVQLNVTAHIICRKCGNAGHIARDCRSSQPEASYPRDGNSLVSDEGDAHDREHQMLMSELFGNAPTGRS